MRIACIAASRVPSRTANSIQVMKVCQALVRLGHRVQLWLPGPQAEVSWDELAEHYGLTDVFSISWIPSVKALRRYDFSLLALAAARRWRAELFYTWPLQAAAGAAALGWPTLLEAHDEPQGRAGPLLMRIFLNGRGAARLLVTTEALREELERRYARPLSPPFAQWAPNGVDLKRYRDLPDPPQSRASLGLREAFTLGYTGHFYSGRGIELMAELARRNPDLQFLWAGGEPAAVNRWRARLEQSGLSNVHLMGFVPNRRIPLVHAACDALLMPYGRRIEVSGGGDTSRFANPMKAFEYMASGRPILSSDVQVFGEILNPENALLLPPEDVDAWDRAVKDLVANPAPFQARAARAREQAASYDWTARARRALEGLAGE